MQEGKIYELPMDPSWNIVLRPSTLKPKIKQKSKVSLSKAAHMELCEKKFYEETYALVN